jgi:TetR/AcrR family transcriptional regulator, cholesterol catabolism regulator
MGDGLDNTKAVRTRQRILASAAREFAVRGFDGTSLRQVAAGADLTLGSLYFHFATKADLVAEVLRDAVDFALARVDREISELPCEAGMAEALSAAVRAHLHALHESRDRGAAVVRVMDRASTAPAPAARAHARRYITRWCALVKAAQRDNVVSSGVDPRVLTELLLGAMNATVGSRQLTPDQVDTIAVTVCDVFLRTSASPG